MLLVTNLVIYSRNVPLMSVCPENLKKGIQLCTQTIGGVSRISFLLFFFLCLRALPYMPLKVDA